MGFKGIKSGSKISKYAEEMIKVINTKYSLLISQLNLKSEFTKYFSKVVFISSLYLKYFTIQGG
jgi:hypothetical protein